MQRCFYLLVLFLIPCPLAYTQDLPDVAQGLTPYTAFHGGELDLVSTLNGSLTVRIPLLSYPQKGELALSYSVIFNSFSFQDLTTCIANEDGALPARNDCYDAIQIVPAGIPGSVPLGPRLIIDQDLRAGGANAPEPQDSPTPAIDGRYYIIGSDNSQHPLGVTSTGYRSVDGSGYLFTPATAPAGTNLGLLGKEPPGQSNMTFAPGVVTDSYGTQYTAGTITDVDGNSISYTTNDVAATDSVGRVIPEVVSTSITGCPSIPGTQLQQLVSAVTWSVPGNAPEGSVNYLFCYASVNMNSHFPIVGKNGQAAEYNTARQMLQSVTLPDGTFWGFVYDSYDPSSPAPPGLANQARDLGELMKLIYPTGGSVNYTYVAYPGTCDAQRISVINPVGITGTFVPRIASRTMVDANGNTLGTWAYTYPLVSGGDSTILSPTQDLTVNHFQTDGTGCGLVDSGHDLYTGPTPSGLPLEKIRNSYQVRTLPGLPEESATQETSVTTTLEDGSASTVSKNYASMSYTFLQCDHTLQNCETNSPGTVIPIGNPITQTQLGFDGTMMQQRSTTYQWQTNPAYLAANLLDIPSSTQTLDASGNTVASTTYNYDGSGSPGGVRGHATSITNWLNTNPTASPTTTIGYNSSGQKAFTIDPLQNLNSYGHTTDYAYNQCNGSVLTSTTNAKNQSVSATYNCDSGTLSSLTDANGNTTSVQWDAMNRITQVTYPSMPAGTPTTSFNYQDAANTVTKTVLATPDPAQTTTSIFDGFGRETQRQSSDTVGSAEVDTTYDSDGRVYSVSNPYHVGDTVYTHTTAYDALGRPLVITKPDGNTQTTAYTGPTVDSYDESQTHMQHTNDALGRLVKVMELGTPTDIRSLETDYAYDPVGSLTSVSQLGTSAPNCATQFCVGAFIPEVPIVRRFSYDSLGRLTSACNPETLPSGISCDGSHWSQTYTYDANGNLYTKTDANQITVSYAYDALNRLTTSTPSNAEADNLVNVYDIGSNGIGRLSSATNTFYGIPEGTSFTYDPMGRVTGTSRSSYFSNGTPMAGMGVQYDLAGNPTLLTYPSGRQVQQAWDSAGRLSTVTDVTAGGGGAVYASGLQYSPSGELTSETVGNAVSQVFSYNSRLQPCAQTASSSSLAAGAQGIANLFSRQASYSTSPLSPCGAEAANNGNIWSITDNKQVGRTQSFGYDSLNRLTSAGSSNGSYNYQYQYDSFGSMLPVDQLHTPMNYSREQGTNRLLLNSGDLAYDAAGQLVASPGHSFIYTAYGQVRCIDNCVTGSYVYNGMGERVFADRNGFWRDYAYLNGQVMAEQDNQNDGWSDYIYANGKKIAKVDQAKPMFHMQGVRDGNTPNLGCGVIPVIADLSNGISQQVIQAGDQFVFDIRQKIDSGGVLTSSFAIGTTGAGVVGADADTHGKVPGFYTASDEGWYHSVSTVSSSLVGQTMTQVAGGPQGYPDTTLGKWDIWIANAGLVHADGSFTPIYTGQAASVPGVSVTCGGTQQTFQTEVTPLTDPTVNEAAVNTNYYLDDHLGTTQMELSTGGWPLWQGEFTPFGQEVRQPAMPVGTQNADGTNMRFKFTGKERDTESGLDYFGARYYASSMGRWMSPDWADKPEAVPYSDLANPQSLNLYGYVKNNPLRQADPDGHCCVEEEVGAEVGAEIGTAIEPGGGTVVGGIIGTLIGGGRDLYLTYQAYKGVRYMMSQHGKNDLTDTAREFSHLDDEQLQKEYEKEKDPKRRERIKQEQKNREGRRSRQSNNKSPKKEVLKMDPASVRNRQRANPIPAPSPEPPAPNPPKPPKDDHGDHR